MPTKIKQLPISERPYEKLEMYGENTLSNAELLAIIIKSGTKEESSVTLAQKILSLGMEENENKNSLKILQELSLEDLTKLHGIGKIKAIQIKAVCELAKRISRANDIEKIKIKEPSDIVNILNEELKLEKREIVKVVILNSQNVIIKIQTISLGGTSNAHIDIRDILHEAIKRNAPRIILVHNHPCGDATPTEEDIQLTKKLEKASELIGIKLLDHIVIGYNQYASIKNYALKMKDNENQMSIHKL